MHIKQKGFLKMKYKKQILVLSIILIFFTYIGGPLLEEKFPIEVSLPQVIRFHVRANSDTQEDQDLKLEVRDAILESMGEKFTNVTDIEESRAIVLASSQEIKTVSRAVIESHGKDYDVNVSLREEAFPIRKYGNLVFPQGNYEALIVEIGAAKGANWWCVMFPPICLVDVTHSSSIQREDDSPLNEFIVDETRPFKLKSKLFDFFKPLFDKSKTKEA